MQQGELNKMVSIGDIMLGDDLGPVHPIDEVKNVEVSKRTVRKARSKYPVSLGLIGIATVLMLVVIIF